MAPGKVTQFSKIKEDQKRKSVPPVSKQSTTKIKKVVMDKNIPHSTPGSLVHLSLYERMLLELQCIMENRNQFEIVEYINNERVNVTPKLLSIPDEKEDYEKVSKKYTNMSFAESDTESFKSINSSIMRSRSSRAMGLRISMDDVMNGIGSDAMLFDLHGDTSAWKIPDLESSSSTISHEQDQQIPKYKLPFIRIVLRKTDLILLFEQYGTTAIKDTTDGNFAESDNKRYDYLTMGRGKIRRRSEGETQTLQTLYKSRDINTIPAKTIDSGCYVSYFDMYDTYKIMEQINESDENYSKQVNRTHEEQFNEIAQLPSFQLASVIMKRLLASNIYEEGQCRFRNMYQVPRMVDQINYKYSLQRLFTINPATKDKIRKAVSDMSFCCSNSDVLAVSYGIYSYHAAKLPKTGEVCVWSIKNPCDPERFYYYNVPVVSVEFSPYIPTLLAIGLYDGSVEVRDIQLYNQPPLAISQRSSSSCISPVLAIKWFKQITTSIDDIDPFLALSQDGSITQYRLTNSPYLEETMLLNLERIEGMPEGLPVKNFSDLIWLSNRCSQGLNLTKHPVEDDIYYVLTDEGCIHKCSTNYQHHYLEVLKTHDGAVNCMDFSPWSPKLFLTCGNDWCIRIWLEGIFKPLITLTNLYGPYQWASWSRTHSTILIAVNRKQCEIWDLKRNILKPMSVTTFEQSFNTMAIFSRNGYSIAIGNERGHVIVNALDEMPFPPYYQYDALEKAIFKAVSQYPDLKIELKTIGYFGHANKEFIMSL